MPPDAPKGCDVWCDPAAAGRSFHVGAVLRPILPRAVRSGGGGALLSTATTAAGNPGAGPRDFRALATHPPAGTAGRWRFHPAAVS